MTLVHAVFLSFSVAFVFSVFVFQHVSISLSISLISSSLHLTGLDYSLDVVSIVSTLPLEALTLCLSVHLSAFFKPLKWHYWYIESHSNRPNTTRQFEL